MEQPHTLVDGAEGGDAGQNKQASTSSPPRSKKVSDHLANERTFLAWVRTGLATIAFGFVVERLPDPTPLIGGKAQIAVPSWLPFATLVGFGLTMLGIVMLVVALLNFLHHRANIDKESFHPPARFAVLLTILTSLIGLLLAGYLILTM